MRLTQTLNAAVQLRRNHIGTIYGGRKRTWGEIAERVARVAGGLAQFGVQSGDRIAILALNSDRYIESFFAIAWVGAVIVPLNTRWAIAENEYALNDSGPKILFVDDNFAAQVPELSRRFKFEAIVYIGEGVLPDGLVSYEALAESGERIGDRSGSYDDLLGIFYTGGTTGFPKGVMLSHRNVVYESVVWIYSLNFGEDTVYLHSAALFHLAGASPMVALTMVGGTHVTIPKFEPEQAMATIAAEKRRSCPMIRDHRGAAVPAAARTR